MKFKTILTMAVVVLCSAACSDEKELPAVADIAGSYEGYTLAGCAYFQNTCVTDETVTVTGNADGTANVTFTSGSWGEFSIPNAQMSESGGTYTLMGSGQTKMGMGGNVSSYDCTYTAVIESREKAQMRFKVSGVMGGLTIDFTTGEVPADLLLAGTWEGYTNVGCTYFQNRYTDDESLKMTANSDETLSVVFESATWGTFKVDKATIKKNGDNYTFTGEGTVSMGMGDNVKDYAFTMTGESNAAKDDYSIAFNVPAVMGGLTITLLPGKAPAASES
ncbi:calycin-like domain-containing protein [Bacteroides acidifaciens]|uniref:calycin-like domain-containing protein n=1 Tax=Bacteroides acidifaciens TaxID=85831 RepID=UPI00263B50AD|nr:calycin-like domain-containing protein [Bacteroides acidifaciens]